MIWSDEVPLHLVQTSQRRYQRVITGQRHQPEHVQPRLQGGGGLVMVWRAFHGAGVLPLYQIQGTLTSERYINILEDRLLGFIETHRDHIFMQDNATSHTAHATRTWSATNNIDVMQ